MGVCLWRRSFAVRSPLPLTPSLKGRGKDGVTTAPYPKSYRTGPDHYDNGAHTWRTRCVPNRPCGRTTSRITSRPIAMVFWYCAPK